MNVIESYDGLSASVIDKIEADKTIGHKVKRKDLLSDWEYISHSEWIKFHWDGLTISLGPNVSNDRIIEFDAACDSSFNCYYYLGVASRDNCGEEALKWIMGAIAYELKTRNLPFEQIRTILPAIVLNTFAKNLNNGTIERNFSKQIFSELINLKFGYGKNGEEELQEILARPEFKQIESNEIHLIIDKVIADNQEQFSNIKEQPKLIQWFVGQVMKESQGKAKPAVVIDYIKKLTEYEPEVIA